MCHDGGVKRSSKKGRAVLAIPLLENASWLLGVEFDSPGNFWEVENPPADWLFAAPQNLRAAGLTAVGGRREPIDEPVVFSWMPAASVFFEDPDGNFLEYISMLDEEPQPELGLLMSWSEWQSGRKKHSNPLA